MHLITQNHLLTRSLANCDKVEPLWSCKVGEELHETLDGGHNCIEKGNYIGIIMSSVHCGVSAC